MYPAMDTENDTQTPVHGDTISQLREERGWTQDDLKVHAGVSLSSVQRAERSDPTLKVSTVRRLASALHVPISRVYDIDEPVAPADEQAPAWFLEHMRAAEATAQARHTELLAAVRARR